MDHWSVCHYLGDGPGRWHSTLSGDSSQPAQQIRSHDSSQLTVVPPGTTPYSYSKKTLVQPRPHFWAALRMTFQLFSCWLVTCLGQGRGRGKGECQGGSRSHSSTSQALMRVRLGPDDGHVITFRSGGRS